MFKLELKRREIYSHIVKQEKDVIEELLDEFLTLISSGEYVKLFPADFFYGYLQYFYNELEFYPIQYDMKKFLDKVLKKFPKLNPKKDFSLFRTFSFYPKSLQDYRSFLEHINRKHWSVRRNWSAYYISIDKRVSYHDPVLELEHRYTDILINEKSEILIFFFSFIFFFV